MSIQIYILITEYKTDSNLSLGSKLQALMSLSTAKQVTADRMATKKQ